MKRLFRTPLKFSDLDEIIVTIELWGSPTDLFFCVEGDGEYENIHKSRQKHIAILKSCAASIDLRLQWIEKNKALIQEELLKQNPMEMIQKMLETPDSIYYRRPPICLKNGDIISFPITSEDLLSRLLFCDSINMEIDADENEAEPVIHMFLSFSIIENLINGYGWNVNLDSFFSSCL